MGRVTYEEMAAFWPTSTSEYARPMNEIPKVVFSRTLERADCPRRASPAAIPVRRSGVSSAKRGTI
jgi:dihydrofolate reductase